MTRPFCVIEARLVEGIGNIAERAVLIASLADQEVHFRFNGIDVEVEPWMTCRNVCDSYHYRIALTTKSEVKP